MKELRVIAIPEAFRFARHARDMSQMEIVDFYEFLTGEKVPVDTYKKWEQGERSLNMSQAMPFTFIFGLRWTKLFKPSDKSIKFASQLQKRKKK